MALFQTLAELADRLAAESSRLAKRAAIAQTIAAVHQAAPQSEDAGLFALYLAGLPFAEADPRKLNTGGALLVKTVLAITGASQTALTAAYRRHGDLGAATYDLLRQREVEDRPVTSSAAPHQPATSNEATRHLVIPSETSNRPVTSSAAPHQPVILSEATNGSAIEGPALTPATLTFTDLNTAFAAIATARTTAVRAAFVEDLLSRATPSEAKYLIKLMLGDMRIGVKQSLIEEAIAAATESPVAQVRHAVMLEADLAAATHRAFAGTLAEARMRLFHPLGFMLASPVDTPEEAVARFTEKPTQPPKPKSKPRSSKLNPQNTVVLRPQQSVILSEATEGSAVEGPASPTPATNTNPHIAAFLEDKYDGMRAQVHCGDPAQPGRVAIYSRNREDITTSFPELAEAFAHVTTTGPLILDGEILAWNFATAAEAPVVSLEERALPFATLGQRIGRKKVSNEWRKQVPVIFMAFDLMCLDGSLILDQPLHTRRKQLESIVEQIVDRTVSPLVLMEQSAQTHMFSEPASDNPDEVPRPRLILSPSRFVTSAEDIDRAYADARARANEGVMLKAADSTYQPGRRGLAWVKLKRELGSLDVVITGAEFGHGRRAGLLSDYTFAVRGHGYTHSGELLNVGKAYSGVTDLEIAELTEFLKAHTLEDHGHFRTVEPLIILEVAFNNIMRSERHASGFALRFPRILRIRTDKPLAEIDTLARVEEIYLSQVDRPVE